VGKSVLYMRRCTYSNCTLATRAVNNMHELRRDLTVCKKKTRSSVSQSCEVERLALGGIVTRPKLSLIGEHGPEIVIKLKT